MSSRAVREVINQAELRFAECWDILASLRSRPDDRLIGFQTTLGQAIRQLSSAYADLAAGRRALVSRKRSLHPEWFRRRQASLAQLQTAIREAIAIGHVLGDAFAWFFYQGSREILAAHLAHPEEDRLLTGQGGAGEVKFVRGVRFLGRYFVLHHSITSILRIGDISLIDLESLSVRAIGELKTTPIDSKTSQVRVSLISGAPLDLGLKHSGEINSKPAGAASSAAAARFRRQLSRMAKTITASQTPRPRIDVPLQRDTRASQLGRVLARADGRRTLCERISEALIVVVVPHRRQRLFSRLTGTVHDFMRDLTKLPRLIHEVAHPNSVHNTILLRTLQYGHRGRPHVLRGAIPLFWWQIEPKFLRLIILREATVISIYNPAHLLAKLEAEGFRVLPGRWPGDYVLEKRDDDRILRLANAWYFVELACSYLWEEDQLLRLITEALSQTRDLVTDVPVRVDLDFEHGLAPPSQPLRTIPTDAASQ